jgi:hypothetical protein
MIIWATCRMVVVNRTRCQRTDSYRWYITYLYFIKSVNKTFQFIYWDIVVRTLVMCQHHRPCRVITPCITYLEDRRSMLHRNIHKRLAHCMVSQPNRQQYGSWHGSCAWCQPLTAETRVWSQTSSCGVCNGQSGTGTGFSPSTSVFPCQCPTTNAPNSFIYHRWCIILATEGVVKLHT